MFSPRAPAGTGGRRAYHPLRQSRRDHLDVASGVVTVKPSADLTAEQAAAIAEVQDVATANGRTVRVKLANKLEALKALARYLGMFVEKHEHAGPGGGPIGSPRGRSRSS
jgi:hypothetical protein